jgi:integrase
MSIKWEVAMGRRKTGSILKRGNVWWIYYTINGKRHARATNAQTKIEAQDLLNTYLPREVDYHQRGRVLLSEFAGQWLERRKVGLKPSAYDSYRSIITNHIIPYFAEKNLNMIYAGDIEDFVVALSKKRGKGGRPLTVKTINNILVVLHRIFDDAVDDGRIEANPVIYRKQKLTYNPPEKDHFSIEEMNLLLQHIRPQYKPFFITAWHTGLRLGELVGLKWEDIDWRREAIKVRRSIYQRGKKDIVTTPKTKSGTRTIFITPHLRETLLNYREQKKVQSIGDYIFEKDGAPFNKTGIVRSQFKQALREAGLRTTLTPHSIRHGLISIMHIHFPEHVVKRMVGHSLGNSVTEIYTPVTDDEMRRYASKLGELLTTTLTLMSEKQA